MAMTQKQEELWKKVQAFHFDEGEPHLSFKDRLRRENQWNETYTKRVIEEYRRFLFLLLESGINCTPSGQVDKVWHLHLIYTRSYWEKFCREIAGRSVHHVPTTGGVDESSKFARQYERTLQKYTEFFGERPPQDIWPPLGLRQHSGNPNEDNEFGEGPSTFSILKMSALFAGGITLVYQLAILPDFNLPFLLKLYGVLTLAIFIFFLVLANRRYKRGPGSCGSGCGSSFGGCGSGCGGCGGD